ncbi:hypothetical protein [Naasia sp. SYSU D00948]|uniref:hypothetical protein n=1 Tax=Naasia sp. SYSU D00948 TaxID=2817379 RepID=UPI001B30B4A1|nr:hypothetical protein [Naasia sp. SYSU D00948]
MFLNLANLLGPDRREQVFLIHPLQLSRWLDEAWASAARIPPLPDVPQGAPELGSPDIVSALDLPFEPGPAPYLLSSGIDLADVDTWQENDRPVSEAGLLWHHLIYAYLIESTGAFEIFAEIVRRLVVGETLGQLRPESVKWMRTTEELFFRDPPLYSIAGVRSELRPVERVNRRNAYWRMFGFDLPHPVPPRWGAGDAALWKSDLGGGVNSDFRAKWTELLRQVWIGLENFNNGSGPNPTDPAFISSLCEALRDMMRDRRRGGLLAREEFVYVTTMSWFHLTLQTNTPIVADLKAEASSPAERLTGIAERVGMRPAQRSRELFELAEPMSSLLRAIERGLFDTANAAATLFDPNTALGEDMRDLINQWQSATGERIKERPTGTAVAVDRQPLRLPTPGEPPRPAAPVPTRSFAQTPATSSVLVGSNGQTR